MKKIEKEFKDYMGNINPFSYGCEDRFKMYLEVKKNDLEIEFRRMFEDWKYKKMKFDTPPKKEKK
jgi:hypothetical protein